MSSWTHINLAVEVTVPSQTSRQAVKDQVLAKLEWLPQISGSEGDAEIFVNVPRKHDMTSDMGEEYLWSKAYITVMGHLRDRTKEQTEKETKGFIKGLKREFSYIRNLSWKVYGDDEPSFFRGLDGD